MYQEIPDAPWIREAETYGPPDSEPLPLCPVCGEECETFYTDPEGTVLGCEHCVRAQDSWSVTV